MSKWQLIDGLIMDSFVEQSYLVKNRVLLSGITPDMWTESHSAEINKFLSDKNDQLLLVYIDRQRGLVLCSSLPTFAVEQIAYFVRGMATRVSSENFLRVIQFGTMQGTYVNSLLRGMHDLSAPTFFENRVWPDSILNEGFTCVMLVWARFPIAVSGHPL